MTDTQEPLVKLERLSVYLERDPDNLALLGDAAAAAFAAGDLARTQGLLDRHTALAPLPGALANLQGLAALAAGRPEQAVECFQALADADPGADTVRANLAWAHLSAQNYEAAAGIADERLIAAVPEVGAAAVQALHHLGRVDEAFSLGERLTAAGAGDPAMMSALALVAMDAEQPGAARTFAVRAGSGSHEGLATLGMLDLAAEKTDAAQRHFDQALALYPDSARALLGQGLLKLLASDALAGAQYLERAATIFDDHAGSWVAAGWARLVQGDRAISRQHFERAADIDPTFAEPLGGLGVLDILDGDLDAARHRTEAASRLDRNGFAAALANAMLLDGDGRPEAAERIRALALNAPVGMDGKTVLQALVGFGLAR